MQTFGLTELTVKFAQNVIAIIEIFYTAQEFMELSEDRIEYIANQELLEEKKDEYKQKNDDLYKDALIDRCGWEMCIEY